MVIITTTLLSDIITKIINSIAENNQLDFMQLYAMTGYWSAFYLILAAIFNLPNTIKKLVTRSTKEITTLFLVVAFVNTAITNRFKEFQTDDKTKPLLSLILTFGTVWFGLFLFNFKNTRFFTKSIRENISAYSLSLSVISMSLIGSFLFQSIQPSTLALNNMGNFFTLANLSNIDGKSILQQILLSCVLGLCFAILVFMTHNVYTEMVDSLEIKLIKGKLK